MGSSNIQGNVHQGMMEQSQVNHAVAQVQSFAVAQNNNQQGGDNSSGFNTMNDMQAPIHSNQMQQPTQIWSSQIMQQYKVIHMPLSDTSRTNSNQNHNSSVSPGDQTGNGIHQIMLATSGIGSFSSSKQ